MEKRTLSSDSRGRVRETRPSSKGMRWATLILVASVLSFIAYFTFQPVLSWTRDCSATRRISIDEKFECKQYEAIESSSSAEIEAIRASLETPRARNYSASLLSGAVQIPSISYDDMGSLQDDPRWEVFGDMADYLETSFPLVHQTLTLSKINTYGLLYTWAGTEENLKPVVLMAHQDVVPVDSIDKWTHAPFSGHIDEDFVYGRGASDCKNVLVGLMESVELLLAGNFAPRRTILLSFGFDEEISGTQGALPLARHIEDVYGKDGVALIVDEGSGFSEIYGQIFATPGVAEKGYIDVTVTVTMPGGHSSIPPEHTAIGILSQFLVEVEKDPYKIKLTPHNPLYQSMVCGATYASKFPKDLKRLISQNKLTQLAKRLGSSARDRYLMATSVAETVVGGGVKVNALPETATAVINHRVSIDESTGIVVSKLTKIAESVAKKHGLTFHAFNGTTNNLVSNLGSIQLKSGIDTLEPAPITPLDTPEYAILAGTIRSVFPQVLVAPGMSSGNTDTKSYWNLTRHIFRFEPSLHGADDSNIHTVDEKMSIDGHLELVQFFHAFIQNVQVVF